METISEARVAGLEEIVRPAVDDGVLTLCLSGEGGGGESLWFT